MHWLLASWRSEALRTTLSVLVFAAVSALILLFQGLYAGLLGDLHDGPAALPADLVGMESGSEMFVLSPSNVAQLARERVESLPGVVAAEPFAKFPTIATWNDRRTPVTLVAADDLAAWPTVVRGQPIRAADEILLDQALGHIHALAIGDQVELYGYVFTIAGFTSGTASPFAPYIVVSYDGLLDMYFQSDLAIGDDSGNFLSGLWVQVTPGSDLDRLRGELARIEPTMRWNTPDELGTADAAFGARLLGPVMLLLNGIAALIGFLAMAVLRFADVQSRRREIGIMRAIGARPRSLIALFATGGLGLALLAAPPALLIALGLEQLVEQWNPMYQPRVLETGVLLRGFAIVLAAAVLGGLVALRPALRIDPVMVFQR